MKKEVIVKHAERRHKNFIIESNKKSNMLNCIPESKYLEKNIEKDYFCFNPKFSCLVAEIDSVPVGMMIYSKYYWPNDGEAIWISQIYVDKKYRKRGVFFKLISKLRKENRNTRIITFAANRGNLRIQKIIKMFKVKPLNMKFYYKILNKPKIKKCGVIKEVTEEVKHDIIVEKKEEKKGKIKEEIKEEVKEENIIKKSEKKTLQKNEVVAKEGILEGQLNLFEE